jgi:hypothetical protein
LDALVPGQLVRNVIEEPKFTTIEVTLGAAELAALQRFADEVGIGDLEIALHFAATQYLTSIGMLAPPHELDPDSATEGSA